MYRRPIQVIVLLALAAVFAAWPAKGAAPETIRDCTECPRMVLLPAGSFEIGSPATEAERSKNEGAQKTVTLPSFAVSETEITRAQYAAFVKETKRPDVLGCDTPGEFADQSSHLDPGASWHEPRIPQTDEHPVVCVSWQDASDYAAWLARKTGKDYRLPSESEWEYAIRGGTTTAYFWGANADDGCKWANVGDRTLVRAVPVLLELVKKDLAAGSTHARLVTCDDGAAFTSAVGSYAANPFGLHDMTGNAWEWIEDCYEASFGTLPLDGKARRKDGCESRIVRGGSWDDYPADFRSATRHHVPPTSRRNDGGFRVARTAAAP